MLSICHLKGSLSKQTLQKKRCVAAADFLQRAINRTLVVLCDGLKNGVFQLAIEAITNIRTVAGLGREKTFVQKYMKELDAPHREAKRKSHIRGLVFGFAQSMPFFAYAGCMYYGGYLVDKGELEYQRVYK